MSTGGAGEILLLPAAALALGGLAIAGLAYGGYLVVSQAGKGLIVCGRKVSEVLQDRAAQQKALIQQSLEYERQVRRGANLARELSVEASQRRQERLAQLQKLTVARPRPPLKVEVLPDPLYEPEPIPEPVIYDQFDLEAWADRLMKQVSQLKSACTEYQQPEWQNMIQVRDLVEKIPDLEAEIEAARQVSSKDVPSLYELQRKVGELRMELAYRIGNIEALQRQQEQTGRILSEAASNLHSKEQEMAAQHGVTPNLEAAYDMLEQAAQAYEQSRFELASQLAKAAGDYTARLSASLDETRRINLQSALDSLRQHLDEYRLPDTDPLAQELRQDLVTAERHLKASRLEECCQVLEQLQPKVGRLASDFEDRLLEEQQNAAAKLFAESLGEMGYRMEASRLRKDGVMEIKAVRPDGAYFLVLLGKDGNILYKTEKFKSKECGPETRRLFDLLQKKGLTMRTETEYTAEDVAARMRETMLRQGYLTIEEERLPDGRILLKAVKSGGQVEQVSIGQDLPEPSAKEEPQKAPGDLTPQMRAAQKARRDSQRRQAEKLRQRPRLKN